MEKELYFHPIIVRDNTAGIAFSCTVLNNEAAKIETIDALKAAMLKFGPDYGNLNVVGSYCGKQLMCFYFELKNGAPEFRFRYFDTTQNKLVSMLAPDFAPDYMSDGVNRVY